MIHSGADENQLNAYLQGKMTTLKDQAIVLVRQGKCNPDEAIRMVAF